MKRRTNAGDETARPEAPVSAESRFLSPRQLAERWDCSPTTAQRVAKNAGIAKYCLGDGRNGMVRYPLSEVEDYEERRRVTSSP